jgi:hypothetical protein
MDGVHAQGARAPCTCARHGRLRRIRVLSSFTDKYAVVHSRKEERRKKKERKVKKGGMKIFLHINNEFVKNTNISI